LDEVIRGQPLVEAFQDDWTQAAHKIWNGLKGCYQSWHVFTKARVNSWEAFMNALPWDGQVTRSKIPSFCMIPSPEPQELIRPVEEQEVDHQVDDMIATAGEDEFGHPRLAYEKGQDLLAYPRVQSTVAYNKLRLDGTKRQGKKRKASSEWFSRVASSFVTLIGPDPYFCLGFLLQFCQVVCPVVNLWPCQRLVFWTLRT
jgi:hypothetical protein